MKPLRSVSEVVYSVTRIVVGFSFTLHGVEKMFGVLTRDEPVELFSLMGAAGIIELVAGGLITVGLYTPWAAFLASGTMAVAYVQFHWKLDFGERLLPAINRGELSLLYSVLFLFIACRGGGSWSVDRRFRSAP